MITYQITIKDNSIPEHMLLPNAITEYTGNMVMRNANKTFMQELQEYIEWYAVDLNTDSESIQILSIIKQ